MNGISAAQLDRMRAQAETLMPDTAVIQAATRSAGTAGRLSETWTAVTGGTVACRIDPVSRQVLSGILANQEVLTVRYQLSLPWDAPLAADRQVVIDGHTYQVVQMEADQSWRVSRRAIVSEVR